MFDGTLAPKIKVEVAWATTPTGGGSGFVLDASQLGTGTLNSTEFFTDITSDVVSINIRRGRSKEFENVEPGSCDIVVDNASGDYDPTNTAGRFAPGGITQVLPMRQVRITAEWQSTSYPIFRGYIEDFGIGMDASPSTTLQCVDAMSFLAQTDVPAISSSYSGDRTDVRVGRILDAVGFPATLRSLSTGQSTLIATTYGDKAHNLLNEVARTEGSVIYADRSGNIVFPDRHAKTRAVSTGSAFTTIDLTDAELTGSGVRGADYATLNVTYGASQVANALTGQREGGSDITVTDAGSIAAYGRRAPTDLSINQLQFATDTEVTSMLQYLLAKFKDPDLRVDSVTFADCLSMPEQFVKLLSLDLQKFLSVRRQYATHTFSKNLCVEGITMNLTRESWTMTVNTSSLDRQPYAAFDGFVLDSDALAF